jgi:hypothetical protein
MLEPAFPNDGALVCLEQALRSRLQAREQVLRRRHAEELEELERSKVGKALTADMGMRS